MDSAAIHEAVADPAPDELPPPPADAPGDAWVTPETVLAFVRQEAARLDPAHRDLYHAVSLRRIKDTAWLAHDFMAVHRELHLRVGRGARSGKRQHAAAVRGLLESSNDADLTLAMAVLVAAIGTLGPDDA